MNEEERLKAYQEAWKKKFALTPESIEADRKFYQELEDWFWDPTSLPCEVKRDRPDA